MEKTDSTARLGVPRRRAQARIGARRDNATAHEESDAMDIQTDTQRWTAIVRRSVSADGKF